MIPFRAAVLIDASPQAVRSALWSVDTWRRAAAAGGLTAEVPRPGRGELRAGDLMRLADRRRRMLLRVGTSPLPAAGVLVLRGVGAARGLLVTVTPAPTAAGTLVTVDIRVGGRAAARRRVAILHRAQLLLGILSLAARERDAPTATGIVVAGVIIRDGAVLAARRTYPAEVAGRWECPGGKVEPGESEPAALARELAEELGITVRVRGRVGPALPLDRGHLLHAYRADLVGGEPQAREHDAVRWVTAAELDAVPWLESDRPLVPFLRQLVSGRPGEAPGRRDDAPGWTDEAPGRPA